MTTEHAPQRPPRFLQGRRTDIRGDRPWSPFRYVGRRLNEVTREAVARAALGPDDVVLDFGCADRPYRHLFDGCRYVPADLPGNDGAELEISEDGRVPLPDGACRLVLSTQVLEHVAEPGRYLAESFRLLAPGGHLVLTTHGLMYLHRDPTDYWRWTCDGLVRVVEEAGFEAVELRGVVGLVPAALQLIQDGMGSAVPKWLRKPYVALFQGLVAVADRWTSDAARDENALVFAVVARRPA